MKRNYFGTDGVRGPYGGHVVNEAFAARLAEAAGRWAGGRGRVLIGRDTRGSGEALMKAVAAGLVAAGMEPVSLGVLPTPAVARAVRTSGAALGVVITASHNPASDNGIKFFAGSGIKLTDEDEVRIESLLPDAAAAPVLTVPEIDGVADYIDVARGVLPAGSLAGWRIILDTAHGATTSTSPAVLRALGAEVIGIGDQPDGRNINEGVGSEHPEKLAEKVLTAGARLGIAHDGDGDRCILCDENGSVLDGDEVLTLLGLHALEKGTLAASTLVITVQSNLGVDSAINAAGGRVVRTSVGDRYVIERMLADGATLGGESSGHIICADTSPTGDGLVAALKVIEVMLATGRPLSALRTGMKKFPQGTRNLKVRDKRELTTCATLSAAISALESDLGSEGRVLVRFSGTEPKLRLLVEGPSDDVVTAGLMRLEQAARADLQVI
ncbi:phosphoglucosamine mutase [Rariglobus hedericola]|uniref:Phosphoglucosamine mutase n=1 Tax=Rariglobus hedericola TaxID=2597822 RepID=A0A556QNI7_9BACT|nr:phosphoglucosamine mutase [Rariglobus hedericola]TSJ78210.1 phosphoglucosamine mutase [Rariglobus hedericola]